MATQTASRPFGVLVVDDEPSVLMFLAGVLRTLGVAVFTAGDGRKAERSLLEHGGLIDAAVVDLKMPGWDGVMTSQKLQEARPGLPCCLMSGLWSKGLPLPEGFRCALSKPFDTAQLRGCLAALGA
jgi:CheY-like chemotaxis protein